MGFPKEDRGVAIHVQGCLAALVLCLAVFLGGGPGNRGDLVVQLLSVLLLATVAWRWPSAPPGRAAWLALLPLALPLLQLLPIPEALQALAPERSRLAAEFAAVGVPASGRMGLVPQRSLLAAAWCLPAVAIFLATLQLPEAWRRRLLLVLVALAALAALLGLAQLADGRDSVLRFHAFTNRGAAVGFFANRNHFGLQLAMALPLALAASGAWLARREGRDGRGVPLAWPVLAAAVAVLLMLGFALSLSRAAVLLGMLGLALCLPLLLALRRGRGMRWVVGGALATGLLLVVQFALFGLVQRFTDDPISEDVRLEHTESTFALARQYWPLGSGAGTFQDAYEAATPALSNEIVHHAHNDLAELWLEGGVLVLPVLAAGLLAFAGAGWRAWRVPPAGADPLTAALARAAWIALLLALLHSLADYPLRTSAHLAIAGLLAGVLAVYRPERPRSPARLVAVTPGSPS